MSLYVYGTSAEVDVINPAAIKSVLITNESGGSLGLSVFPYKQITGTKSIRVVAGDDVSNQNIWDGLPFPNGFTVVPDTNLTFFLIEYVPLTK